MLSTASRLGKWATGKNVDGPGLPEILRGKRSLPHQALTVIGGALRATLPLGNRGTHITRYSMYRAMEKVSAHVQGGPTLSVSGSLDLCVQLGIPREDIVEADYPECDLLNLAFPDNSFANLVSDQVLEHVAGNPQRAIDESFRVVRPGGLVIHTTCFLNPVHMRPADFWRFTTDGLRLLFQQYDVIEAGGWGNAYMTLVQGLGLRTEPVPHASTNWLHKLAVLNDPDRPVVTWIIARKPVSSR